MAKNISLPKTKRGVREVHPAVRELNEYAAVRLNESRRFKSAITLAKRAIRVTPNSRELWSNLGTYLFNIREYGEAEAALQRAIKIDPNYSVPYCNLALVYGATRHYDLAMQHYERAAELDASNLAPIWDRSLLKLKRGDFIGGFEDYEVRIPWKKRGGRNVYPTLPAPYYNGEDLTGKSVYLIAEQGIGDTILFSRFIPWLAERCAKVYLCVSEQVWGIFYQFRELVEYVPQGIPIPKTDYSMAMGSLPHWAGATLENLTPDPGFIRQRVVEYAADVPFGLPKPPAPNPLRVGIVWRGNPEQDRDEERSVPFEVIQRVAEFPDVWVYSLQVGDAVQDIYKQGADGYVFDLSQQLNNRGLVGCGAALLELDLLITSCTMISHLAGVLGVPCWTMLCYDAYWPWLNERTDSPWYPNTRLFRQPVPDNWVWTMNDVMKKLEETIVSRNSQKGTTDG